MRIAVIVASNIVKDPRVMKQSEIVSELTDNYIIIGKKDENATKERLSKINFNYKLINAKASNNIIGKAITRLSFGLKLINYLKKFNPDVIHANDFDMLFFAYFVKKKNQNLIYDAHEIYAKNGMISKVPILSKIIVMLEKHMMKKVNHFVTVSNAAKEYYQTKGYKLEPVVITNAPIKREFQKLEKNKKFEAVYQGIVSEGRGYEEFAESARFTEAQVTIRGYGPTMGKISDIKNKYSLENLKIEDPVEMDEMIRAASRSHVGIVMTKPISENYEYTVSNKLFEYLHAGIPVILSPVKEHIYLNNIYKFGIVIDEVTPSKIADAISRLKNDEELYKELEENAIKAAKIFTWQNESKKLKEVYENQI
ncbi:capsular biosynthesis protein [Macrococcoides caseolyticum]|uniref:glycosyltransferase n=1 Tax=Macrococcoides caseolyticum TaxID=69966 RepID=UPI000C33BDCC|nr:glycosyltransferase [Macrococcus caseolyticus]PKF46219.1 capsular biosynthesis protein [Macrococcus caseolyticus]